MLTIPRDAPAAPSVLDLLQRLEKELNDACLDDMAAEISARVLRYDRGVCRTADTVALTAFGELVVREILAIAENEDAPLVDQCTAIRAAMRMGGF
jgi:hypothetical protein